MKGLITVNFTIGKDFNTGDFVVTTKAILQNKEAGSIYSKKGLTNIKVKSKYPVSVDRLQLVAAKKDMLDHLEDKGGLTFRNCPAEFIYVEEENGDHYYLIVAELGTADMPLKRTFYLNQAQEEYLRTFTPEYEFTKADKPVDDTDEQE